MYTQCPNCDTVFKVTAEALRAAQGMVRCGICSSGFNALENLSEQPVPRPSDEDAGDDTITVEELPGTEFIELSGSAVRDVVDEDLGPIAEQEEAAGGDAVDALPDAALEFHGSPEDLERLFVQGDEGNDGFEQAIGRISPADLGGIEVEEQQLPGPRPTAGGADRRDPGSFAATRATQLPPRVAPPAADDGLRAESRSGEAVGDSLAATGEYPVLDLGDEDGLDVDDAKRRARILAEGDKDVAPVLLIPDELRHGTSATAAEELARVSELDSGAGPRRWPVTAAAAVLALALLAQAAHHWREDLARNPLLGPWVLRAYGMLGPGLAAPADLAAFELRQLGAGSEPSQAGRIKVRASIVNRAAFAQRYPVLRLTVQDRFGSTIGMRDLGPAEYLPGGEEAASGLLGPDARADAEVVFVDPGRDAVGFELDVCLRSGPGLRCSADLPRSGQ